MGTCYLAGKKAGAATEADCREIGGTWVESGGGSGGGSGGTCFLRDVLTRSLGQAILSLGETFGRAADFKHQILVGTKVGDLFLRSYYARLETTFAIVQGDFALIGRCIETWLSILPFVQGMLEENGAGRWQHRDADAGRVQFTTSMHRAVTRLIRDFRERSPDAEYSRILDDVEEELKGYVGLSPAKALAVLRRTPRSR